MYMDIQTPEMKQFYVFMFFFGQFCCVFLHYTSSQRKSAIYKTSTHGIMIEPHHNNTVWYPTITIVPPTRYNPKEHTLVLTKNLTYTHTTIMRDTRADMPHKKIVFSLHIHKSGGSSMCRMAQMNHMRTSHDSCNVQKNQRCCGGETIQAHADFYRKTRYNFVANEHCMYTDMDMQHYQYITVLRNSFTRYCSHFNHVLNSHDNHELFPRWMHGQPDNWNTRHICGTKCLHTAKYGLDMLQFNFTLKRLDNFTHISFMEQYYQSMLELSKILKWNKTIVVHTNSRNHFTDENPSNYIGMTYLDDLLYTYAVAMQTGRTNTVYEKIISNATRCIQRYHNYSLHYSMPCGEIYSRYR